MPTNIPSTTWLSFWLRKVRITRGLSCELARMSATTMIENVTPATETVTVAIAERMARALSGRATKVHASSASSRGTRRPAAIPTATISAGTIQNARCARSPADWSRAHAGSAVIAPGSILRMKGMLSRIATDTTPNTAA